MGIGGCNRLCPAAKGHSLVALFSLSVSIKNRPLHGPWSSHILIIPSTNLLMGVGLSCYGFWLFLDRLIRGRDRWRSKHHIEVGPQMWGLWSSSLDGDLEPLTGVEWVDLVCA
jgi:hypothetical protein